MSPLPIEDLETLIRVYGVRQRSREHWTTRDSARSPTMPMRVLSGLQKSLSNGTGLVPLRECLVHEKTVGVVSQLEECSASNEAQKSACWVKTNVTC